MMVKKMLRQLVRIVGFDIQHYGWAAERLRKHYADVSTIIDIGVARGTPELYAAFPNRFFVLIEPLEMFRAGIEQILQKHSGDYLPFAAGSSLDEQIINIDPAKPSRSSLSQRTSVIQSEVATQQTVQIRTLDSMLELKKYRTPFGIKIDIEGHELEALKGATETLKQTRFVIIETNIAERFVESYRFEELIRFMHQQGFEVIDILNVAYLRKARRSLHCDLYFGRIDKTPSP